MTPTLLREILWFAPLHDIGKIGVPDSILLEPGALTDEERAVIQEHVQIGADVVHQMDTGSATRRALSFRSPGVSPPSPMSLTRSLRAAQLFRFDREGYEARRADGFE